MTRKTPSEPLAKRTDGFTFRAVAPVPSTYNEESRSVEFVLSTEAPATVFDPERFDFVDEVLLQDGMTAPDNGQVPLIDSHDRGTVTNILGSVRGFKREEGKTIGRAYFARDQKSYDSAQKVRDGHIDAVSVGYVVTDAVMVPDGERTVINGREYQGPLKVSTRWHLREVSLVAVGADQFAKVRSEATQDQPPAHELEPVNTSTAEAEAEKLQEEIEMAIEETKTPATPPATVDLEQVKAEARRAETERVQEIRKAAVILGDESEETVSDLIARGVETADALRAIIAKAAAKSQPLAKSAAPAIEMGATETEKFRAVATDSMLQRAGVRVAKPAEGADQMRGVGFLSLARHCLKRAGKNVDFMSNSDIIETVLSKRFMGTSDFDYICGNVTNKAAMVGYMTAPQTFRAWCRIGSLPDFKSSYRVKLSDAPDLSVNQSGQEVAISTFSETGEAIQLATYARKIRLTRQAMINDDLNIFQQIAKAFGARAGNLVNSLPYAVLLANAALSDGTAIFHTSSHGANLASSGAAPSDTTIGAGWKVMMGQTGPNGSKLNIAPKTVICSPGAYMAAAVVTGSVANPASGLNASTFNPFNGMQTVADANITNNKWYLAADQNMCDTVEVAFLDGKETPTIVEVEETDILGLAYVAYIDAVAKALDYRGLYSNPGA